MGRRFLSSLYYCSTIENSRRLKALRSSRVSIPVMLLIPVQISDCFHFGPGKRKIKDGEIFPDVFGIARPRNHGHAPLQVPAEDGLRRGFLMRGGEYDYERCAKAVVDDFRKGRIGKICLE